jgi:hypothetical protein
MNNTDPYLDDRHPARIRVTGALDVPLPQRAAFMLFTARGERGWTEGWDPCFPAGDDDDTVPGTTFLIHHGAADSVWVVAAARPPREIGYVRVTPADTAGTVTVSLEPSGGRSTHVTVTYDLTALAPPAREHLAHFRAGFGDFLRRWEQAIAEVA